MSTATVHYITASVAGTNVYISVNGTQIGSVGSSICSGNTTSIGNGYYHVNSGFWCGSGSSAVCFAAGDVIVVTGGSF